MNSFWVTCIGASLICGVRAHLATSFAISDVPSLRARPGGVSVDIGFLAGDAHLHAFTEIFAKCLADNAEEMSRYTSVVAVARKPMPLVTMQMLKSDPHEVARQLYQALVPEVRLRLNGARGSVDLVVCFDNPSFEFINAL